MVKFLARFCALALAVLVLWGCSPAPTPGTGEFTYRAALTDAPFCYSPLDWSTDTEEQVLALTASPLYAPSIADGESTFLPEMAAGEPVDISAQLGRGAGTAWQIDLQPTAVWSDGTAINADTYLHSLEELLDPQKQHSRAGDYFFLENAYAYYYQDRAGQVTYRTLADAGYLSAAEALRDSHALYIDMTAFWGLGCGWQSIDSNELYRDEAVPEGEPEDYVSPSYVYNQHLADGAPYAAYQTSFVGLAEDPIPAAGWEDVGIQKTGDYQITMLTAGALTAEELMLKLSKCFLIPESLYDGAYGTGAEYYLSCGPYTLTAATAEGLTFARNESWYGYADESRAGEYAATSVYFPILSQEDALAAFEAGELDTVTVSGGENARSIPQTYTSKLTFNTSLTALTQRQHAGINKTILSYRDFRQAISLAIDRQAFVDACVPSADPTLGLLNGVFLTDIAALTAYRDTEAGQQVLRSIYGSGNGYDPQRAKQLFQSAYDAALAEGQIGENDVVELEFLVYSDEAVYQNIVNFLQTALDAAAAGTSLAGRLRIVRTVDPGYYDAAREGAFDIILSTWGGAAQDPYSIMSCYCDREKSYEYGFDPSREGCTLTLEGSEVTRSYRGWYEEMIESDDDGLRLALLAGLEESLLSRYDCVPIYERNMLFMDSDRITRPVEEALPFAGFGGVRYIQFTADDAGNEVERS